LEELSIRELAYLRLLNERLPSKTTMHVKIFEFLMKSGNHFTVQEVSEETKVYGKFAQLILDELAENRLIERKGCLFRCNGIAMAEIIRSE